ncbi:MAG: Grx4 family monothiol glutaredoxin [Candidatus Sericytochromatia bacterium]|nr:Grx4 family monothiol glutaredoxin [Candidatus Sericytochromatia bacterium]
MSRDVMQEIEQEVKSNPVLLYMKGSPEQPMCGFSFKVVQMLSEIGKPYAYVNILADEAKRQAVKEYSSWPTFPQLYVGGELVGGCDIVTEMFESQELQQLLENAGTATAK